MQWTERYRPASLDDVVGNPSAVETMREFADGWVEGDPDPRALVLSGDPGTGKSSAAHALAREYDWDLVEMNTSDQRNKEAIERVAQAGAVNESFGEDGSFRSSREGHRKLIVLDEADNLFGRKDYGGAGAMAETLRQAQQPVILIVNDYYELKRRNRALGRLAEEVKFRSIHTNTVKKVLRNILEEEGVRAEPEVVDTVADAADGDLRSAINDLEMLCRGRETVTAEDLDALGYRNRTPSIFDALDRILQTHDAGKAREATWDLDESPEDLILWIDENLPVAYREPAMLRDGYQMLSRADIFLGRVRNRQEYGLWSYARDLMTAGVNAAKGDRQASRGRYGFPDWLRKMSRSQGSRSTRDSLAEKIGDHVHSGPGDVLANHLPFFRHMFGVDRQFAAWATWELELADDEVAYLLDTKPSTKKVRSIMDAAEELEQQALGRSTSIDSYDEPVEIETFAEDDTDDDEDDESQASLGDF